MIEREMRLPYAFPQPFLNLRLIVLHAVASNVGILAAFNLLIMQSSIPSALIMKLH